MTDTPRTDAEVLTSVNENAVNHGLVLASFARRLEIENGQLRAVTEGVLQGSGELTAQHATFQKALQVIAANTCCGLCREASLVAKKALFGRSK